MEHVAYVLALWCCHTKAPEIKKKKSFLAAGLLPEFFFIRDLKNDDVIGYATCTVSFTLVTHKFTLMSQK